MDGKIPGQESSHGVGRLSCEHDRLLDSVCDFVDFTCCKVCNLPAVIEGHCQFCDESVGELETEETSHTQHTAHSSSELSRKPYQSQPQLCHADAHQQSRVDRQTSGGRCGSSFRMELSSSATLACCCCLWGQSATLCGPPHLKHGPC